MKTNVLNRKQIKLNRTEQMNQKQNLPATFEVSDNKIGLKGWLAIDSTINNYCSGGLRLSSCVSKQEVAELAKAMTLKFGFTGLPHGGAKAGIICDEGTPQEKKLRLLAEFIARVKKQIKPYVYNPYPDMNTNRDDIFDMLTMTGSPVKRKDLIPGRGGWYTGLTTIAAAKIAARYLGLEFSKATVVIEGFGKVGSAVAHDFYRAGNKVVAISTSKGALYSPEGLDISGLIKLYQQFGSNVVFRYSNAERIDKEKLCELDVDILLPCATGNTITMDNAAKVRARIISPGANFPLSKEAERYLWQNGIICIPHFISNLGGVLGGTMEFAGFDREAIIDFVDTFFSKQVEFIIKEAKKTDVVATQIAENLAMNRFERIKALAEKKSLMNKVFSFGLDLYRSGIIPKRFCRKLAKNYFKKRIEGNI